MGGKQQKKKQVIWKKSTEQTTKDDDKCFTQVIWELLTISVVFISTLYFYGEAYEFSRNPVAWIGLGVLIVYALARIAKHTVVVLLLPLGCLIFILTKNVVPDWEGLFTYAIAVWMVCQSPICWHRRILDVQKIRSKFHGTWKVLHQSIGLVVFILFLDVIESIMPSQVDQLMAKRDSVVEFQNTMETIGDNISLYVRWHISGNGSSGDTATVGMGNINNDAPIYNDREIVTITTDFKISGNIYLRNAYGIEYAGGRWQSGDFDFESDCKAAGYSVEDAQKLLNSSVYQRGYEGNRTWDTIEYRFSRDSITNNGILIPYQTEPAFKSYFYTDDVLIRTRMPFQNYTIVGWRGNKTALDLYDKYDTQEENSKFWEWYNGYVMEHYLNGSEKVPAVPLFVDRMKRSSWSEELYDYEEAMQFGTEEDINYTRVQLANAVGDTFYWYATYSLELDELEEGQDPIEYFMTEDNKQGYCVHFASAGTLILREMGVPARYVTGYMVKSSSFRYNDESWSSTVIDRNAHAWVEIYLNGVGWVPIEMTPGYEGVNSPMPSFLTISEGESSQQLGEDDFNETAEDNDTEASTETDDDTEASTETDGDTEKTDIEEPKENGVEDTSEGAEKNETNVFVNKADIIKSIGLTIVCIILIIILVVVLVIRYSNRKKQRMDKTLLRQEVKGKQYGKAIYRMNRRLYLRWNKECGTKNRGSKSTTDRWERNRSNYLTDAEYEKELCSMYSNISEAEWHTYMELVKKAAFSNMELNREEAKFCYEILRRTKK